ncbi:MAG: caspase family protein [Salinivirgaceae bacterium]|nr:caspase family protein [Salinivirgaceae bacterium]
MKKSILTTAILIVTLLQILAQGADLKTIKPPKGKVIIYIVRPSTYGFAIKFNTFCNGFDIGFTKGKTYLFTITDPGELVFSAQAENKDIIRIDAKPNEIYFVKQEVKIGVAKARIKYNIIDKQEGYKALLKCKLSKGNKYSLSEYENYIENNLTGVPTDTIYKEKIVYVNNSNVKNEYVYEKLSDIDNDIPINNQENSLRFALIIGNEDYSSHQIELNSEINVDFARNDASAFKEYALNVLGIPSNNIIFLLDATTGQMNQGISKMNLLAKNTKGNAEFYVYFAGHGLPDEQTKDSYLMPVDVSGKNASEGIKLTEMYKKLTEFPTKSVTVFIDACFSGGARNQGLLASCGVKIKPKHEVLNGNLVVFAASSGEQSSLPLKEKQHGMFTYFLLKKIQETQGDINYKKLSEYIKDKVSLQSVLINDKEQIPQTNVSSSMADKWQVLTIK